MRVTRVHVPADLSPGALLTLPEGAAQHLVRVLRLEAGAELTLFNGQGGEHAATITAIRRNEVTVRIGELRAVERESPLQVTLLQGIARGDKMDLILQKATELGITRVVPLTMARSNVKLTAESAARKQAHWQGVVIGACEQSGRNRVPGVDAPLPFASAVSQHAADVKLLLTPTPESRSLPSLLASSPASIALLIGPEGGFDPDEVRIATLGGYAGCRLGPRVLRTETAALAALAALQILIGDFRDPEPADPG